VVLRRFLGLPQAPRADADSRALDLAGRSHTLGADAETETVRQIVAALDAMPADPARFLAGFAYVLSRTAEADLNVSDAESREMERIVVRHGKIPAAQAVIVVQIAKTRSSLFGPTENYLVTREFRAAATDEECLDLLRCCWLIGGADGSISAEESGELNAIADELGVEAAAVRALRAEHAEQFAALRALREARAAGPGGA
jgi:uncharacterized tellurite resistance protein B-like protein